MASSLLTGDAAKSPDALEDEIGIRVDVQSIDSSSDSRKWVSEKKVR